MKLTRIHLPDPFVRNPFVLGLICLGSICPETYSSARMRGTRARAHSYTGSRGSKKSERLIPNDIQKSQLSYGIMLVIIANPGLDPFVLFLIFKFKFKFIDLKKNKFKFIDFKKTIFKFKFIDFAKVEFKFKFKFINSS